jgi:hypothetical protein
MGNLGTRMEGRAVAARVLRGGRTLRKLVMRGRRLKM